MTVQESPISDDWRVIKARTGWAPLQLRQLWEYRELLFFFIWRDIKVRYKQTILGASWAIIQPVSQMVVFSIFFGQLAKLDSEGFPYPIFNYAALLPWTLFAGGLTRAANSIVGSGGILKKVYFPRLIAPMAAVLAGLPDFLLSFIVMLGLMFYFDVVPNPASFLLLIPFLLLALITALAFGLWLAALNAIYRDVRYLVGFTTQLWMFITPVVYSSRLIENDLVRSIYALNPMTGVVEGFRWVLLGQSQHAQGLPIDPWDLLGRSYTLGAPSIEAPSQMIFVSTVALLIILVAGLYFFRRMERTFADVV